MNLIHVLLLGIVEGVTEFLPVSSTGHLILVEHLLKIPGSDFLKTFDIFIQLGAILAVVWLYFPKIRHDKKLWRSVVTAFIPTGILGTLAYPIIKNYLLDNILITVLSLFAGGILLLLLDRFFKQRSATHSIEKLPLSRLLVIGVFQSLAFIPGVSRSASSIIGGLSVGLDRVRAVEFSFLLAIPTMAVAVSYDIYKSGFSFTPNELAFLLVGFVVSFLTALIAIKTFIKFVQNNDFTFFAVYRIILALIVFALLRI